MRALPAIFVLLLSGSVPATAQVELGQRADGVKVIRNESSKTRAWRLSARLMPIPTRKMAELVERMASEGDLDPRLVQAVMQVESGYNPRAYSNKGAIGLMQLMPATARELAVGDPWDPEQNVRGGVAYLKRMLDLFSGDLDFALAAYNAGPNAVLEHAGIPPYAETRSYVRKIRCIYDGECDEGENRDGGKVYMRRDANNQIVITSSGPGG